MIFCPASRIIAMAMILAIEYSVHPAVAWAIIIGMVVAVGVGALWFLRFFKRRAKASLQQIYDEVGVTEPPAAEGVHVVFYTYYGLLAWVTQTEHHVVLPLDRAELMLRRLNWFNITWGQFAYGAVFIPLISYGNYLIQLRRIRAEYITISARSSASSR